MWTGANLLISLDILVFLSAKGGSWRLPATLTEWLDTPHESDSGA